MHKQHNYFHRKKIALGLVSALASTLGSTLQADTQKFNFQIESQSAGNGLMKLAELAGVQIAVPTDIGSNVRLPGINGKYTLSAALDQMLNGSGLVYEFVSEDSLVIRQIKENNTNPDSEKNDNRVIEDIIVTASRRAVSLQDTPMSVSVIDPDADAIRGFKTLRDVIDYTPGVFYTGGRDPLDNTITMRGVDDTGLQNTVGTYIDDVPIGSGARGGFNTLDVLLMDIERIELSKGPQGTLFGSAAMGGVIRYITRDPSTEELGGDMSFDVSNTKEGDVNHKYSGRLRLPLIEDRLGMTLAGFYQEDSGFVDRDPSAVGGASENANAFDRHGVSAKLSAHLTENLHANLFAVNTAVDYRGSNLVTLQGPPFEPVAGPYVTLSGEQNIQAEMNLYSATFNYDMGNASLISTTSYQDAIKDTLSDLSRLAGLIELLAGEPSGTVTSAPFVAQISTDRFVQEVRLQSAENKNFEWTVGLFYSEENSDNEQKLTGLPINFLLLDVAFPSGLKEYAAFTNLTYYLTPELDISLGGRLAKVETRVELTDIPELITKSFDRQTDARNIDTYSLSARYRPNTDLSIYARIASGYRSQLAALPLLDVTGNRVNELVAGEDTVISYEIGAKGDLREGTVSYDIATWYIDWQDLQANTVVNGSGTIGSANSPVTAWGLEGTVVFSPVNNLNITGSFSYTNSTLDNDETAAFGALAGEHMTNLPKVALSLKTNYDFLINGTDAFAGGGIRYIGSRNSGFVGGVGASGETIVPIIKNIEMDSMLLVDANFGFRFGSTTISLYATNLFDKYGYSSALATAVVGGLSAEAAVVQPRTVGALIKMDF